MLPLLLPDCIKLLSDKEGVKTVATEESLTQYRIDEYGKKQDAWASFKLAFNNDMGDIENRLKDLADRNKK